ncbi:hypothetical protein ANCDUO_09599 [Ancylostoma duodenale]|uniref:Transient receptor ion channel domain-containing protein n=1 Tax=Ancylostoma duodenale TaxID=51022 RepID=A0A0C2DCJ0_9BILA|nr:hypothetical protein ANCDUO_09599 [Ancylostoma duodenale]
MRAISSEAFLWLATDDPFAAACSLSQDIAKCMQDDNFEFMDTYRVLYNNVQRFTCRVIDNTWRVEELDIFLAHKCHCPLATCANPYPRVQLALEAHMRHFAGSPNVQRAMACIWWRGWGNFGSNPARDSYRVLRHVFLYPILALMYIFTNGKIGSSFEVPLARFDFMLIGVFCLALHLWLTGVVMPMEPDLRELNRIHWLIKGIGGSVISVGRCVSTIYNYLVVMGVIMVSFAVGINLLVQPYLNSEAEEDGVVKKMGPEFRR